MQYQKNLTQEILSLEKKYWTAMREQDLQTALSLTDFPCLVAGSQGAYLVDQNQFEKMFKSHKESLKAFHLVDGKAEVRQVTPDTAIVAYKVQTTVLKDGEQRKIDAVDTSTWVKRDNNWTCAMHTETELHS